MNEAHHIIHRELQELRNMFYKTYSPVFKAYFNTQGGGTNNWYKVHRITHKVLNIRSVNVFNADGDEVSIKYEIDSNQNVTVYSNVPLANYSIIIY